MEIIKKKIRPFLLGLIIPAILIFTAWIILPSVIIATLSDYVKEKSGGTYTLTIEGLDIEMAPLTLTFSRVNLIPSKQDSSLSVNENKTTRYTFSSSKIELNKISTASLIRNKEIECSLMKISEPSITLKGRNLLQQDSLQITSVLISDVAPLFDHIKKISVKKIELEEADFSFYSDIGDSSFISRADHVSVDLLGFRTGRSIIRHHDRYFETDDVNIRMNDFKNDMGDNLHILTIDTLTYSLKTTDIRAWGFKLNPLYRTPAKNFFEVNVPEVYVKSRSIAHFALSDSLKITVYAFVDGDPYGYFNIYRTLKVGSGNAAHLNQYFCVPKVSFLGVTPQDVLDYKLPTHPLKEVDIKRAKDALKNDPFVKHHKSWQSAINQMLKMGVRVEQQAFAKHGLDFVVNNYLPAKLKNPSKFLP